jgi:hypothetical protein
VSLELASPPSPNLARSRVRTSSQRALCSSSRRAEYVHRLLGFLCIGFIALGATIWLVTMVPACMAYDEYADPYHNPCLAFARGGIDGGSYDPLRNVVILRIIVAPLWGTLLPLMAMAGTTWHSFDASVRAQVGLARQVLQHVRHPVIVWLWLVGVALGLAIGTWAAAETGAAIGGALGAAFGAWLGWSPTIKLHWYEFCYWLHRGIAYITILVALIARFDVFWPCAATWLLFALDKLAQARATQSLFIDALESRCINDPHGRPSKLRLVLNVRNTDSSAFTHRAASRWVKLSHPHSPPPFSNTLLQHPFLTLHPTPDPPSAPTGLPLGAQHVLVGVVASHARRRWRVASPLARGAGVCVAPQWPPDCLLIPFTTSIECSRYAHSRSRRLSSSSTCTHGWAANPRGRSSSLRTSRG